MEQLLFIYNPKAGSGKVRSGLGDILDAFSYRGFLPAVYPTRAAGDATRIIRELGGQFRRVVCCGGDGTLHEVVTGLMDLEDPPVLGYIPAGTTNDFSRNLNLPRDMGLAAGVAVGPNTLRCDMGRFNGAPFVYVAAFGAFTEVSYDTPQQFKSMFGHLAYILEGIGHLGAIRSRRVKLTWDGGELEEDMIYGMVSNTRSVGGFKGIRPEEVRLDDGLFEVAVVRRPTTASELQDILTSLVTQDEVLGGPVVAFRTSRLKVEVLDPMPWTLDGEYGGSHRLVEVEAVPKALRLCYRPMGKR